MNFMFKRTNRFQGNNNGKGYRRPYNPSYPIYEIFLSNPVRLLLWIVLPLYLLAPTQENIACKKLVNFQLFTIDGGCQKNLFRTLFFFPYTN